MLIKFNEYRKTIKITINNIGNVGRHLTFYELSNLAVDEVVNVRKCTVLTVAFQRSFEFTL
jgi:hypothetical protein